MISIHALLAESDLLLQGFVKQIFHFYPRSPCGERPEQKNSKCQYLPISIHALLAESDGILVFCGPQGSGFLSTLSLRRATCPFLTFEICVLFLSTLSLRRATRRSVKLFRQNYISIHALLAESDISVLWMVPNRPLFLSTLSLRRATFIWIDKTQSPANFYPRSPCGERRERKSISVLYHYFYPRSPCGERQRHQWPGG